jgi:hypothetical protein
MCCINVTVNLKMYTINYLRRAAPLCATKAGKPETKKPCMEVRVGATGCKNAWLWHKRFSRIVSAGRDGDVAERLKATVC